MDGLQFDPVEHRYTLDGAPIPGVTEMLEMMYDFRFVDPEVLERSRDMGSKVHKTIELFEAGTLQRTTLHSVLDNHLKQWERFKSDFRFLPVAHEVRVASRKFRYAGTYDCNGLLLPMQSDEPEETLLLDVKTGDEYPAHHLQTAGYLYAAVEEGKLPANTKRASLYLDETSYKLRWHTNPADTPVFLSLAGINHWRRHHNRK